MFVCFVLLMTKGLLWTFCAAVIFGLVFLLLVIRDKDERNRLDRIIERSSFMISVVLKRYLYRGGPASQLPWGTTQLPGIAAAIRMHEYSDSYNRPFALLFTPISKTYSVVLGTDPDGSSLVDQEQVDLWVADWGNWIRNLSDEPSLIAAAVTIESAPESGAQLRREIEINMDPNAPAVARAMYQEIQNTFAAGSSSVRCYISLTYAAAPRKGAANRKPDEMAREIASRLPALTADLEFTGAGPAAPLSAQELCEVIRIAYDPAVAGLIDEAHVRDETPDLLFSEVGPTAHVAAWDGYRHDSGYSKTWGMTIAPRGAIKSNVLSRLLAPHRDIARKRVTLLYKPIETAVSAGLVHSDTRSSSFKLSSSNRPSARDQLAHAAAIKTAAEEASGAGLVNFSVMVTATTLDPEKRDDMVSAIDNLTATAKLQMRLLHGSQDSAFALALPLGLIPSKHVSVPTQNGKI
ncbi:hypothetical protein CIK76_18895 [Glutamicibacter sp. BW80]|nr:hypothetical protein CIK76_18895 [Glutamicibacter sp. BW80]